VESYKSERKTALKRKLEGRNKALRSLRSLLLFTCGSRLRGPLPSVACLDAPAVGLSLVPGLWGCCAVRPPVSASLDCLLPYSR
jgi:hypothetical protein